MRDLTARTPAGVSLDDTIGRDTPLSILLALGFGLLLGVLTWLLIGRVSLGAMIIVLAAGVAGALLSFISWRNMALLVTIWLFTMSGFRAFAMIHMPFMPDVSLERVIAVWIAVIFSVRLITRRDSVHGPYLLDVLLFLHTLYVLANVTFIGNPVRMHEWMMSSVSPFIAYLIGKNILRRDGDVRYLLVFFFVMTFYYYVQSLGQRYGWDFLVWPKGILDRGGGLWQEGRSRGPFLHPPLFGQVMAMLMLVQFYFFYRVKRGIWRSLILVSIAASTLGIIYTYTRAPWVAAVAGILTMAILRPRFRQLTLSLGVIAGMLVFFGKINLQDERFLQERVETTETVENRLAAFSAAVRMWRDHPVLGIGYFNWTKYYWRYQRGENIPFYGYITRQAARRMTPHDIYWSRLAEEGLVGMALLVTAFGVGYLRFRRLWREVPERAWLNRDGLAVFAAIFVSYLVGGAFIDFRYFDLVNAIPYLLAGILYGYQIPEPDPPVPPYRLWTPPDHAADAPLASATDGTQLRGG
jgi:O-antigen ligase